MAENSRRDSAGYISKNPPFEINNAILTLVAEIGELLGKLTATQGMSMNPTLRRKNRIRTIYASLAIEQNSLSIEQVTAVLNGKRVIAPPKDIAEVRNAYEIYERMDTMDPFFVDNLLAAHEVMMRGLHEEAGAFRAGAVGVVNQAGEILHFGALPRVVPDLVEKLLTWARETDLHMLIRSCVFHYELEVIHPFADGNGRMGRLWHTLLLSKWNPVFAWLPVETIIHDRQKDYYAAINASNHAANGTIFVEFMLSAIKASLIEAIEVSLA
jgi:Fic family protein